LDELELALSTIKSRSVAGLPPHIEALQIISAAAREYHDGIVPYHRKDLQLVPRSREQWSEKLQEVIMLAEETQLHQSSEFLSNAAIGLARLGCPKEFTELVTSSLSRGVVLDESVLEEVTRIASADNTINAFYPHTKDVTKAPKF
jgi:hypothetical protein